MNSPPFKRNKYINGISNTGIIKGIEFHKKLKDST